MNNKKCIKIQENKAKQHKQYKLTNKQKMFCEEYLVDLNGAQAAIRAGYSKKTAKEIATENLTKPHLQQYLYGLKKNRIEKLEITQDFVLKNLIEVMEGCKKEVVILNQKGQVVGEGMYDAKAANKSIELLGTHVGMFVKKTDITSKGKQLNTKIEVEILE